MRPVQRPRFVRGNVSSECNHEGIAKIDGSVYERTLSSFYGYIDFFIVQFRGLDFHVHRHHLRTEFSTHLFDAPRHKTVHVLVKGAVQLDASSLVVLQEDIYVQIVLVSRKLYRDIFWQQWPEFADPGLDGCVVGGAFLLQVNGRVCGNFQFFNLGNDVGQFNGNPVLGIADRHVRGSLQRGQIVLGCLDIDVQGVRLRFYLAFEFQFLGFEVGIQGDTCGRGQEVACGFLDIELNGFSAVVSC